MFADVTYIFKILFKHRQFLVEILLNIFFRVFNKYWTHGHINMNGFRLKKTGFTQKAVHLGPVCNIVPSVYYLQWVIHVQFENCVLNRCAKKKKNEKKGGNISHTHKNYHPFCQKKELLKCRQARKQFSLLILWTV